MKINGIPGSLAELLKPVEDSARLSSLYPADFDALWNMGSIGIIVQRIEEMYKRRKVNFNHFTARGVIGEYRFLSEFKRFFPNLDAYVFNNCRINNTTEEVSGDGLASYPDHLVLSRKGFVYVETKNWTREYAEKHQIHIKKQIDATMRNIKFYFGNHGVTSMPVPVLYDAAGSIDVNGVRVIRKVSELGEFFNGDFDSEHDRIFEVLSEATKSL